MDPCDRPNAFLPRGPFFMMPLCMTSLQQKSFGKSNDMHLLPVHMFPASGGGNSASLIHMTMVHISALFKYTPSDVIIYEESKESCTMPMTGLLDCGVKILNATDISSRASALL